TRLHRANLKGTVLHGARMDPATVLSDVTFDSHTWLGDVIWNGVSLARIDWDQVPRLGDEDSLRIREDLVEPHEKPESSRPTSVTRITAYLDAARAYHQLANALQSQGLSEPAGRYAYRAQVLERKTYLRKGMLGRWFFSLLLGLLAGYGYRMGRIIMAYLLVVGSAAVAYFMCGWLGYGPQPPLDAPAALLVSITAFHGRVFSGQFGIATPQAWIAAIEAVLGLLVEGVFIAMLTQRFFGK
ncbi:MAG TPA: pentapeptide repeat-containing protein, partial [Ktedonobacterales bacterium]